MLGTADVSVEFGGANVYAQLNYSVENYKGFAPAVPGGGASAKPWGFVVGGGWYFSDDWELFGRYEWSDTSTLGTVGETDNINIVSVGVNKYFAGHNAKWSTDVGIGLTAVDFGAAVPTGASPVPITGWNADNAGVASNDGQVVLRTQLQILF